MKDITIKWQTGNRVDCTQKFKKEEIKWQTGSRVDYTQKFKKEDKEINPNTVNLDKWYTVERDSFRVYFLIIWSTIEKLTDLSSRLESVKTK